MLTDHQGYKILVMRNLATGKYKVFWGMLHLGPEAESSAEGFDTSAEAYEYAKRQIDQATALTVHKPQRREDDGDIIFAS